MLKQIPVLIVTIVAAISSGAAVSKVYTQLSPLVNIEAKEVKEVTITPSPEASNETLPIATIASNNTTVAQTGGFTLASLAKHNKAGDCYVAYRGTVYNVSNHSSWRTCVHHGYRGGTDITSVFPHSTSYFNSIPKMGTMQAGQGASASTKVSTSKSSEREDEDEDEDEKEVEDHKEDREDD